MTTDLSRIVNCVLVLIYLLLIIGSGERIDLLIITINHVYRIQRVTQQVSLVCSIISISNVHIVEVIGAVND